ncbi:hypothetical protein D9757_015210 [Collybiopsis confluens]|uniref:DUF6533 domain-containing protein n=1 Tax=Collybiopsis confluens TaxID=2823264 RepID=A0A8H5CF87_9AGAR|nr:hypothetical protein D9757_015210 [Collybiopsis confluens]
MSTLAAPAVNHVLGQYFQAISLALAGWDYILTFEHEVDLFWPAPHSIARTLFFFNRYLSLFTVSLNSWAIFGFHISDNVSCQIHQSLLAIDYFLSCHIWIRYLLTGFGTLQVFAIEGILITRVYGIYDNNNKLLRVLCIYLAGTVATSIILITLPFRGAQFTSQPAPGVHVCTTVLPPQNIWSFWIPILAYETTLFLLVLFRVLQHCLEENPCKLEFTTRILNIVVRDSLAYFLVVLIAYTINALVWRFASPELFLVLHGITLASITIAATRMIINLKEEGPAGQKKRDSTAQSGIELAPMRILRHSTEEWLRVRPSTLGELGHSSQGPKLEYIQRLKELSRHSKPTLDELADPFNHPIRRTFYSKWKNPTKTSLKATKTLYRVEARQRKAKSVNPSSDNRGRTRKAKEKATVDEPEGPSIGAYPKSPAVRSASQDNDDQFREQPESPLTPIGESPNSNNEQGPNPFNFESINLASTQTPTLSFDYPSIFSSWFQSSFPNLNLSHSISSTSHPIFLSSTNMSNRNNIPQIGLPTLSNNAVTQLAAAAEKLPKLYKTPPILNIEDPVGVIQWFEAAEWIFDSNGITSDDAKLKLALDWSTYPTRKLFMGMKSVRTPNYDEFVKEVRNILPEEMLDVAGSMYELDRIVNEYEPLSIRQKAEFRLYNVLFVTECEKLMTDRPILANRDAVRTYLKVFEESTRSMVFDQVRRDVKPATIGNRRKEDPITLKEAVAAAEKVFSSSNYESIYGLTSVRSSGIGSTNPESYRRSQIAYPLTSGLPAQSNFDYLKSVRKIKQENDVEGGISDLWKSASKDSVNEKEKLEFEKERLASQQDVNEAWLKEMRQMTLKVGEGLSTVASLVGAAVSQRQPNFEGNQSRYGFNQSGPSGPSARYGNTYSNTGPRQMLCFMCRAKDHLLAACPIYQDYVKRGWLVPEGNGSTRMKLRDEVRMPRDDENTPRYKLIEDIAKSRGWGKAESYFANMVDEEEDEMNRQLDPEDQVQVLLRELAEAKNAMLQMNQQRPSDEVRRFNDRSYPDHSQNTDRPNLGKNY